MARRLTAFALGAAATLACHPDAAVVAPRAAAGDGPPDAPVVATLGEYGPGTDARSPDDAPMPVTVAEYGPQGSIDTSRQLHVRFNQPMDTRTTDGIAVTTTPELAGAVTWIDPYRLVFSPESGFASARRYDIVVRGDVATASGIPHHVDLHWSIETIRPSVSLDVDRSYWSDDARDHWKTRFGIFIGEGATTAALRHAIRVTARPLPVAAGAAAPTHEVPFTLVADARRDGTAWTVRPRRHWPADSRIELEVAADLVSLAGPLPVGVVTRASLDTAPGLLVDVQCDDSFEDGCGPSGLTLAFDNPVPRKNLARVRARTGRGRLKIEAPRRADPVHYAYLRGDIAIGDTVTVAFDRRLADERGQRLAGPVTRSVEILPPPPSLDLVPDEGTLVFDPASPQTIGLEARYLESATVRAVRLDDRALARLLATNASKWRLPTNDDVVTTPLSALDHEGDYAWTSRALDLEAFLDDGRGAVLVEASPGPVLLAAVGRPKPAAARAIVQVTDLGAVAALSASRSLVRVSALSTGEPVAGAHVTVHDPKSGRRLGRYGQSGADGVVWLPAAQTIPQDAVAIVHRAGDRFALRLGDSGRHVGKERVIGAITSDRRLYQPGDRMRAIGWAAVSTPKTDHGLRPLRRASARVRLEDPRGRTVVDKRVRVEGYGKYWVTLDLPAAAPLGSYRLSSAIGDEEFSTWVKVREFRVPTFEVDASANAGDVERGTAVRIDANARYLYGRPSPILVARQVTHCRTTSYVPPDAQDWTLARAVGTPDPAPPGTGPIDLDADDAARGHVDFTIPTAGLAAGVPRHCAIEIAIQDAGHEEMGANASFIVHPPHYLLLGPVASDAEPGAAVDVSARAVDREGATIDAGRATLLVERVRFDDGEEVRTIVERCAVDLTADATATCTVRPRHAGRYVATLTGQSDGVEVTARRYFGVYERYRPPPPPVSPPRFELDAPGTAAPGDTLDVAIVGPPERASGLVVGSHGGIRWLRTFALEDHRASLRLPVTDAWIPLMRLEALLTTPKTKVSLPSVHRTSHGIDLPADSRALTVTIDGPETASPGKDVDIAITILDADGDAVASHVTLWAVDEAVLALEPLEELDLVSTFAAGRGPETYFLEAFGLLRTSYVPRGDPYHHGFGHGYGRGGGAGFGGRGKRVPRVRQSKAAVRTEFDSAPIFFGDVATGPDGRAVVTGTLPDNLTTFRVVGIASASVPGADALGRFGRGEDRIRVSSELTVQPLLPRVLRPGDEAQLGALVANLSGHDGDVEITLDLVDAAGVLRRVGPDAVSAPLKNGNQHVAAFSVAALGPGSARVRLTASLRTADGRERHDAVELPVPVVVERTLLRETAVYGSMASSPTGPDAVAIALSPPGAIARGSGEVRVTVQGSLLGGYIGAAQDLVEYPYGCVEQTSSKMVPLLALASLEQTHPAGVEDVGEFVAAGVERLQSMQTAEGGFGYWPGARTTHFYATAYATWILTLADEAGLKIPADMLADAREYLGTTAAEFVDDRGSAYDDVRLAMAVHALAEHADAPADAIDALWSRRERLPVFARALLLMALSAEATDRRATLLGELEAEVDERDAFARTRAPSTRMSSVFDSPVRSDAMVLLALLQTAPDHRLVEKLARGLALSRDAGSLRNTQENAYALLAMAAYARAHEAAPIDTTATAWVGPSRVVSASIRGPQAEATGTAPLPARVAGVDPRVTLEREGTGRLYYRVGMKWAPASPPARAHADGLVLARSLRTQDGPVDASAAGGGAIDGGALVALDVEITADMRREYVAIELPLPAGLEAVDTTIGKGRRAMTIAGHRGWWVSHEELRSDRVLLFADDLAPGRHRHTVYLRATTPGKYRLPPAQAHAMYSPEVRGHTAAATVTVR